MVEPSILPLLDRPNQRWMVWKMVSVRYLEPNLFAVAIAIYDGWFFDEVKMIRLDEEQFVRDNLMDLV